VVAADVLAWTINTYDPTYSNMLTTKRVKNATTPAGQAPVLTHTYDANSLYPTGINRVGDKNGDGVNEPADAMSLVYDTVGRVTTGIDTDWQATIERDHI